MALAWVFGEVAKSSTFVSRCNSNFQNRSTDFVARYHRWGWRHARPLLRLEKIWDKFT